MTRIGWTKIPRMRKKNKKKNIRLISTKGGEGGTKFNRRKTEVH